MASDYHPIYSTLWGDEKLEGAPFEERGFFAHLCSNNRVRPSGIFRVTDAQLAADTTLQPTKVRTYCTDLDKRGLIVRDGAWLFVRAYFKRQPKGENLLKGVASDIATCSSVRVLESFALKYPIRSQWVTDRLATLDRPINDSCSTEQCSAVAVQSNTVQSRDASAGAGAPASPALTNGFHIPNSVAAALSRAPRLGGDRRITSAAYWLAEVRANQGVDFTAEVLKAEAWMTANPKRAARSDLPRFLHNWLAKAKADLDAER